MRRHTDDPIDCWCEPALLFSPDQKTAVHRWMLRDQVRGFWYNRFGWPPVKLDPILESMRRIQDALVGSPQFH